MALGRAINTTFIQVDLFNVLKTGGAGSRGKRAAARGGSRVGRCLALGAQVAVRLARLTCPWIELTSGALLARRDILRVGVLTSGAVEASLCSADHLLILASSAVVAVVDGTGWADHNRRAVHAVRGTGTVVELSLGAQDALGGTFLVVPVITRAVVALVAVAVSVVLASRAPDALVVRRDKRTCFAFNFSGITIR